MSDAPQAAEPEPSRVARPCSSVRRLIDYGRKLAHGFRSNPGQLSAGDIAAILTRITRDLQMPNHPLWPEIRDRRLRLPTPNPLPDPASSALSQPSPAPACTGPPL